MPELQDFDPRIYFRIAAENLFRSYGAQALHFADHALNKMKMLGDEEGFEMWLGIHEALIETAIESELPSEATIH